MSGVKRKDAPSGTSNDPKKQKTHTPTITHPKQFKVETTSAETHAKQRALAKERRASKPNADAIQRSKKIWERLRRKSHVPAAERKELVAELFDIITGRISDFVFKHDSVRVIQCALKYANVEQRRLIAEELKGDIRTLAESRYGKFLVAKMVSTGDEEVRDTVVPQFYGHVRRLINHPEASWVVDDIYRGVATKKQKAMMLREWYGAEFALFQRKGGERGMGVVGLEEESAELKGILEKNPEKRKPILQYLLQMINGLIQKKMTGFTMLHDAMLQYFLALTTGSEEQLELLEILKGDIDKETEGGGGDLFRNLAFTKSGSRLVCLALAYGSAKDRKMIMRVFKDAIEMMALDQHAKMVLVVGLDVPDDTKMSSRSIFPELLGQTLEDQKQRLDRMQGLVTNLNARVPILYPLAGPAKWLVGDQEKVLLEEAHAIRANTSKKAPEVRRKELIEALSPPLLEMVAQRADTLTPSSFGCQFITEVLLECIGGEGKTSAKEAVASIAAGDVTTEEHPAKNPAVGRMLKALVLGGQYNAKTKQVTLAEERLGFGAVLYPVIKDQIVDWACSDSSFVVVGLLESEDVEESIKKEVMATLKRQKKVLEAAAKGTGEGDAKGNAGAKILVEKIE